MADSDKVFELVIQAIKEVKEDVKSLDSKIDAMQEIHLSNSAVLREHERRSTASEKRLDTIEKQNERRQGFFVYGRTLLVVIAALAAFFKDVIASWFSFHK